MATAPDSQGIGTAIDVATAIDHDVYCLHCGYNLRGLCGNPVRCPECGGVNDRSAIEIPAPTIAKIVRDMETAPSLCVGVVLVAVMIMFPLASMGEAALAGAIGVLATPIWFLPYFRMKAIFNDRLGWKSVLRDFHLATVCWAAGVIGMISFLILLLAPLGRIVPTAAAWPCLIFALALFPLGMLIYRKAQERMGHLQRDKAVAIAREYLRGRRFEFDLAAPSISERGRP